LVDPITVVGSDDAAGGDELSQDFSHVAGAHAYGLAQLALRERGFGLGEDLFDALPGGRLDQLRRGRLRVHDLQRERR
jgi:hypothetical protein